MRGRILTAVRQYPGLHLRELARQLDTSVALVEYHIPHLVRDGAVVVEAVERYQRVFPAATADAGALRKRDRNWLSILRQKHALEITLFLLEHGPQRHKVVADRLGIGKSKLSFYVKKLHQAGVTERNGFQEIELVDPEAVRLLLDHHQPTQDLLSDFADVWRNLYGTR